MADAYEAYDECKDSDSVESNKCDFVECENDSECLSDYCYEHDSSDWEFMGTKALRNNRPDVGTKYCMSKSFKSLKRAKLMTIAFIIVLVLCLISTCITCY